MATASTSSPMNPHFFQPLLPGFHSHLNIPMAFFSKHFEEPIKNQGARIVKLRSDASDVTWEVKMDGRRLTQGWQKFATSHDLRVGDIVIFRYDGDFLLHVSSFGPSCCEIRYNHDDVDDGVIQISSDSKKNQNTRERGTSSDHNSCFVACVTTANLSTDTVRLPMNFARSNGLTNRHSEIKLLNEEGKQWRLLMRPQKASGRVCIRSGWKRFCDENNRRANDYLTFKLIKNGTTPVLQLCSSSSSSSSSTTRPCRFLTLTIKPYNLKSCTLLLPAKFVEANGIENARKITLVDRYGHKTPTSLKKYEKRGRRRLGKEWKEFCEVNKVKTGESFELELIKEEEEEEDTDTHLLKFCSKV